MPDTDTPEAGNGTLLAGKYKTPQELEHAYIELQRKLGERNSPTIDPLHPIAAVPAPPVDAGVTNYRAKIGQEIEAAFTALSNGDPSAMEKFATFGISPTATRFALASAIDGQNRYAKSVMDEAGGPEGYKATLEFMATDPDISIFQREAFNSAMGSRDPARVLPAVRAARELHARKTGFEPSELQIAVPSGKSVKIAAFKDKNEAAAAIANPKYKTDEDYRAQVQAQIRVSTYETFSTRQL